MNKDINAIGIVRQMVADGQISQEVAEKYFPELKESEDERIRKSLIDMLKNDEKCYLKEIAWLEKQGEPKEINPSEFDSQLNRLLGQFKSLPKEELASSLSFYLNVVQNDGTYKKEKQGEQKPADWSEEDEKLFKLSLENLTELKDRFGEDYGRVGDCINWLKYLKDRYTWKPSDEQIESIRLARTFVTDDFDEHPTLSEILVELEKQLKKLREE